MVRILGKAHEGKLFQKCERLSKGERAFEVGTYLRAALIGKLKVTKNCKPRLRIITFCIRVTE